MLGAGGWLHPGGETCSEQAGSSCRHRPPRCTRIPVCMHAHTCTRMHAHAHTCTRTHTQIHMHAHAHTHTHTHACTRRQMHMHAHTCTCTCMHTHAHTRMHTRAQGSSAHCCTHPVPPKQRGSLTLPDPSQPLPGSPPGLLPPTFCLSVPAVSPLATPPAPHPPGCCSPTEAGATISPGTQHPPGGSASVRRLPLSTRHRNRTVFSSQQSEALEKGAARSGHRPAPGHLAWPAGCRDGAGPFLGEGIAAFWMGSCPFERHGHHCGDPSCSKLWAPAPGDGPAAAVRPGIAPTTAPADGTPIPLAEFQRGQYPDTVTRESLAAATQLPDATIRVRGDPPPILPASASQPGRWARGCPACQRGGTGLPPGTQGHPKL